MWLLAAGAALGALSYLDKKKQEERQMEALRQEQAFNKAVAPTVGWTGQYKGPTDYSKVQSPNALIEVGSGAMGGAAMGQQMAQNDKWNAFMDAQTAKIKAETPSAQTAKMKAETPSAQTSAAPVQVGPQAVQYPEMYGPPAPVQTSQGTGVKTASLSPQEVRQLAKWEALASQLGYRQNA